MRGKGQVWASGVLLLVWTLLAGCGDIQPFRHRGRAQIPAPLREIHPAAPVTVYPPEGTPPELAEAMAETLREADVPATTAARSGRSLILDGAAWEEGGKVEIEWRLHTGDGSILGRIGQNRRKAEFERGGKALMQEMAREAAPLIVALFPEEHEAVRARTGRTIALGRITAPGDGSRTLDRALRDALPLAGLGVGSAAEARWLLEGRVDVSQGSPGQDLVALTWIVRRIADGMVLGSVEQANGVPAGTLEGPWGPVARLIAEAAAGGIAQVVRDNSEQKAAPPARGGI